MLRGVILASALALVGCGTPEIATPPRPTFSFNDPTDVYVATKSRYDEFKKLRTYIGPDIKPGTGDVKDSLFLRGGRADSGPSYWQIYVASTYQGGWRYYSTAYDSNGNALNFQLISRDIVNCDRWGCTNIEQIGLNVSRDYLEAASTTGIRFQISGKAGEAVYNVPSGYVKGFLKRTAP